MSFKFFKNAYFFSQKRKIVKTGNNEETEVFSYNLINCSLYDLLLFISEIRTLFIKNFKLLQNPFFLLQLE